MSLDNKQEIVPDVGGRLKSVVKHIKKTTEFFNQELIANKLGVDKTNLSSAINGNSRYLTNPFLEKVASVFGIDEHWLLTGEGAMLKGEAVKSDISHLMQNLPSTMQHITPQITEGIGVPYFDVDFVGGFDVVMNDQTVKPVFYINYPPFNGCTCWVNLIGDSMKGDSDKSILPNSIIALKYEADWNSFTLLNENYAIVTDDFRTVKMLGAGKDDEHFNMIPHNQYYSSQQIPKSMIRHLFRVKGSMKKFF